MTSPSHRPGRMARSLAVVMLVAGFCSSQMKAQESAMPPYDANCNPSVPTEGQNIEAEYCRSHIGCNMVAGIVSKTCRAVDFLSNIGRSAPSGTLTNEQVLDAATPEFPRTSGVQRLIDDAKAAAKAVLGSDTQRELIRTDDGRIAYVEAGRLSGGNKNGALIYPDGTMERGRFDPDYRLSGSGMRIRPDGSTSGGTFQSGKLSGDGFATQLDNDRTVLVEGTFDGDTPVGEVVRTYADGSKVREIWENGRMVERGTLVPKGQIPPPVRPQTQLAAADDGKEGLVEVARADGSRRYELWCQGRMVDEGGWYPKGHPPRKPARQSCTSSVQQAGAPTPRPTSTEGGGGGGGGGGARFSSVCARNYRKLNDYIVRVGGVDWGIRVHSDFMRMWSQCRGNDPEAERQYQENADYLRQYQSRGHVDRFPPATAGLLDELNRAINNPNYSAELGSARGDAGGAGAAGSASQASSQAPTSRPGTSVGEFKVASPVLPASFYSQYSARGLPPETIEQQATSSPELNRIQSQLNSTSDTIMRMKLLIAQLEGMIVIHRQSQDVPGARERIQGMINSRDSTIRACQGMAADPGGCVAPLR